MILKENCDCWMVREGIGFESEEERERREGRKGGE